jgi:hypothetical protein
MHLEAVPQRLRWELKIERPILLGHSDGALPSPALRQSLCSQCPWYNIYIVVEPVRSCSHHSLRRAFETGGLRARLAKEAPHLTLMNVLAVE